jgi:hypothetical protein
MPNGDPLLDALFDCEARLTAWLSESTDHAELFHHDPLAAIRAANTGMDESLLLNLQQTMTGIALKLKAG